MGQKVLITGASGLIGTLLTNHLLQKGYPVIHLGREARQKPVPCFQWNIEKQTMDPRALDQVTSIIHLAGAGVADERWSAKRKREILESRTRSTQLLFNTLNTTRHQVKNFVSASAIGYYGFEDNEKLFTEDDEPGRDFLAAVVKAWEAEIDQIEKLAVRVVKIRIGIVLSNRGGALPEMARPVRFGFGAPLASGKQMMSWIHEDDLIQIFLMALETENMRGAFNAVAPAPVSNAAFTKTLAQFLKRPLWVPPVPGFVLKGLLGEMADLVINGSRISSQKISNTGFRFAFPDLDTALSNLLHKR
jgi:uncharacterized protein